MIKLCYLFNIYIENDDEMIIEIEEDMKIDITIDSKEDYSLPISLCQGVITIAV